MYETLTLKNYLGTVIGVVESIDGVLRVKYSNSRRLQLSLEHFILDGINVSRFFNKSIIRIKANPSDSDFLEKLSRYIQITSGYYPVIKRSKEIEILNL